MVGVTMLRQLALARFARVLAALRAEARENERVRLLVERIEASTRADPRRGTTVPERSGIASPAVPESERQGLEDVDEAPVEPISPELVLVSPELREQAIARLPDFGRRASVTRARAPVALPEAEPSVRALQVLPDARGVAVELIKVLPFALGPVLFVTLSTLALTVIANATR